MINPELACAGRRWLHRGTNKTEDRGLAAPSFALIFLRTGALRQARRIEVLKNATKDCQSGGDTALPTSSSALVAADDLAHPIVDRGGAKLLDLGGL
jgi:hypothetical protein